MSFFINLDLGINGETGTISATNSLIGSTVNDNVGVFVTPLTNGNYVVGSPSWNNGGVLSVGAVTFGDGTTGISGTVSSTNSLVGSIANDQVGSGEIFAFTGGNYAVISPNYDNGGDANVGAVTYLSGLTGNFAPPGKSKTNSKKAKREIPNSDDLAVDMSNSVIGTTPNGGNGLNIAYDQANDQLVVGRPADNIVTMFSRLGVTAAEVTVAGRVQNLKGIGIPNAIVSITDSNGQSRTVRSNSFGYYEFDNVEAGETYIFDARAKGYSFATQVRTIHDNLKGFDMFAQ